MKIKNISLLLLTLLTLTSCKTTNKEKLIDYPPIPNFQSRPLLAAGPQTNIIQLKLEWQSAPLQTNWIFEIWESKDLTSWNLFASTTNTNYIFTPDSNGAFKIRTKDTLNNLYSEWNK